MLGQIEVSRMKGRVKRGQEAGQEETKERKSRRRRRALFPWLFILLLPPMLES